MRTYVGRVESAGLRRLVAEDVIPCPLLSEIVREWASPHSAVVQATLAEDDAELIRRELVADRPDSACNLLLNRARQLVPLRPDVRDGDGQWSQETAINLLSQWATGLPQRHR